MQPPGRGGGGGGGEGGGGGGEKVCMNNDPELTLTYFTVMSNLVP